MTIRDSPEDGGVEASENLASFHYSVGYRRLVRLRVAPEDRCIVIASLTASHLRDRIVQLAAQRGLRRA